MITREESYPARIQALEAALKECWNWVDHSPACWRGMRDAKTLEEGQCTCGADALWEVINQSLEGRWKKPELSTIIRRAVILAPSARTSQEEAMKTLLEELEAWRNGHKSRSAEISIDDGYGATCWRVWLGGNGKKLGVQEVSFFDNTIEGLMPGIPERPWKAIYQHCVYRDEDADWPGLIGTLRYALEKAEEYGL